MKIITLGPNKTLINKHSSLLFSQGLLLSTNNQDEHLTFLIQSTLFEDYNSLLVICLQPSPTFTQFPAPTNVMLHDPHSSSKSQHNVVMKPFYHQNQINSLALLKCKHQTQLTYKQKKHTQMHQKTPNIILSVFAKIHDE
jgi:hypothetical protein